jgi:hypothetical protein
VSSSNKKFEKLAAKEKTDVYCKASLIAARLGGKRAATEVVHSSRKIIKNTQPISVGV